jgi:hypothetical protein
MSFPRARTEEQLQLYSFLLGFSNVVLKTTNLLMKVEEDRSSLKKLLHKTCLKENLQKPELKIKVEQVEVETPTPQVVLQKPVLKIKVEHVEEQVNLQKLDLKNKVACRGTNRSTKTRSEYQSRRRFKDIFIDHIYN